MRTTHYVSCALKRLTVTSMLLAACALDLAAAEQEAPETLLLQRPAMNRTHVVFVYAQNLWIVPRAGGTARPLTTHVGLETRPRMSPDGTRIAFSAEYGGNLDVFTMPVQGGMPTRHTWHPGPDIVEGWHPDGKRVLFTSRRASDAPVFRAFLTSPTQGGLPESLPLPRVGRAAFDPSGSQIAYTPIRDPFRTWKRYRGGQTPAVWIYDTQSKDVQVVPHENASDTMPSWIGSDLYFASDRSGQMNAYRYDATKKSVRAVTSFKQNGFGVRSMSAGPDGLVFTQAGAIHIFDPTSGKASRLRITVPTDGLSRLPRWESVKGSVRSADVSPNGKRAVFEVRGEIVTVPKEHGSPRHLSRTPGAHDRNPTWSPDGKQIAWFSDQDGEYKLVVRDRLGEEEPKRFDLKGAGFYTDPVWSPDGKHILYSDKANRIAMVTLKTGDVKSISQSQGSLGYWRPFGVWSPDSKWIAVERKNPTTAYGSIHLYEVASGTMTPLTDQFGDSHSPAFSRDGKLLYFVASVRSGPSQFGLDMGATRKGRPRGSMYVTVLKADGKNPLAARSDEALDDSKEKKKKDKKKDDDSKENDKKGDEKNDGENKSDEKDDRKEGDETAAADDKPRPSDDEKNKEPKKKKKKKKEDDKPSIDVEGLNQRILALPGKPAAFYGLGCTKSKLIYIEFNDDGKPALKSFSLKSRKHSTVASGCSQYAISHKGTSLVIKKGNNWSLIDENGKSEKRLNVNGIKVRVDPAAEWRQILREVWRIQRDYFYDPNLHGIDWDAMWERWSAFLPYVQHRNDLNVILQEMMGELCCGHEYVGGGDYDQAESAPPVGLLGANVEIHDGHYRLAKIYRGQNWNPGLRAPLTEPGVSVSVGDYVISINGIPLNAKTNFYEAMEGTAGQPTRITFSSTLEGDESKKDSVKDDESKEDASKEDETTKEGDSKEADTTKDPRTFTIVPIASEGKLRRRAWVEANRARVNKLSDGRLAYIYMPDTGRQGIAAFDRDYYSQIDKQGVVLDERYNGGGKIADYVVNVLARNVLCYWMNREGWVGRTPFGTIEGPKVMIINDRAGSGGDAMPWLFRELKLGPLVGTRTWGGLVGISGYPALMDGGYVTSASFGIMDREGNWIIENEGVAPDYMVEQWPKDVIAGRDPQLEKAVQLALEALKKSPPRKQPTYVAPATR